MNIEWTAKAQEDLENIFNFYTDHFSKELARKTIKAIFNKISTLKLGNELGQKEELLIHLNQNHRYLISNHNKIIYKVVESTAYITHVFDTRQNPEKLK